MNYHLNKQVDVLLITALWEELEPLLNNSPYVKKTELQQTEDNEPYNLLEFVSKNGKNFSLAAIDLYSMGQNAAAIVSSSLVKELKPSILLMSGICAGLKSDVSLGDIIVGDSVFNYELGKLEVEITEELRKEIFYHDTRTINLNKKLKPQINSFKSKWNSQLLKTRPIPLSTQGIWLMEKLLIDPPLTPQQIFKSSKSSKKCPNWQKTVKRLKEKNLIIINDSSLSLTEEGKKFISEHKIEYMDGFEDKIFEIHIQPIASGNKVIKDESIFKKLKMVSGKVLGLDMETAAIGEVADYADIIFIVAKAVVDFADYEKDDTFRKFACKVSSTFLIDLLIEHFEFISSLKKKVIIFNVDSINDESIKTLEKYLYNNNNITINYNKVFQLEKDLTDTHNIQINDYLDLSKSQPSKALEKLQSLKEKAFNRLDDKTKYRLLISLGQTNTILNDNAEAAKLFTEALNYNKENESARTNASLGYLMIGDTANARNLLKQVISNNSNNTTAYSLLIDSYISFSEIEEIINTIPNKIQKSALVAESIGVHYFNKAHYEKAKEFFEYSVNDKTVDLPELKVNLAKTLILLTKGDNLEDLSNIYNQDDKDKIEESIKLVTEAWESNKTDEMRKINVEWLTTRIFAYAYLGNFDASFEDIDFAIKLNPENLIFKKIKALFLFENKEYKECKNICEEVQKNDEDPLLDFLLAKSFLSLLDYEKAEFLFEKLVKSLENEDIKKASNLYLFTCYQNQEKYYQAKELIESLLKEEPNNIKYLIFAGSLYKFIDKFRDNSLPTLKRAFELGDNNNYFSELKNQQDTINLANEFFALQDFIYSEKLYNIYLKNKNKSKYIEVYLKYLISSIQTGNTKQLEDNIQDLVSKINELSLNECTLIFKLLVDHDLENQAIKFAYEARRKFYSNPIVHAEFNNLLAWIEYKNNLKNQQFTTGIDSSKVNFNTVVFLDNDKYYIIEDRIDINKDLYEINSYSKEFSQLIGKKFGDEAIIDNQSAKITFIIDKYIFSVEESDLIVNDKVPEMKRYTKLINTNINRVD